MDIGRDVVSLQEEGKLIYVKIGQVSSFENSEDSEIECKASWVEIKGFKGLVIERVI